MQDLWELKNNNFLKMYFHGFFQAKMFSCHSTSEILTTAFPLPCKERIERADFFKAFLRVFIFPPVFTHRVTE